MDYLTKLKNFLGGVTQPVVQAVQQNFQNKPIVGGLVGQAIQQAPQFGQNLIQQFQAIPQVVQQSIPTPQVGTNYYNIMQRATNFQQNLPTIPRITNDIQRISTPVTNYIRDVAQFAQGQGPRAAIFAQSPMAKMTPEEMALNFSPMGITKAAGAKSFGEALLQNLESNQKLLGPIKSFVRPGIDVPRALLAPIENKVAGLLKPGAMNPEEAKTFFTRTGIAPTIDNTLKAGKKIFRMPGPATPQEITTSENYLNDLAQGQQGASNVNKGNLFQKVGNFLQDVKTKLVDSAAPIEDILASAQKKFKYNVLPGKDISNQIDKAIRSRELAGQFLKDNGMVDVIKNVPDINTLDQYLIAKHVPEVEAAGFKTGRNLAQDAQLVNDLAPTYEPFAQKVVQYGQKLLDYATQTGLVSKETAQMLKQKYPNYVPLNRIFNELEKSVVPEGIGRGIASLSKQTVVQGLKGSERAIQNPTESLLTRTLDAFAQGERNQAGQMLASYKGLPGFEGLIRELKKGESAVHTFSYLDNGVKKTFETTPEIATAAKLLDKRQLGLVGQIFSLPVRLARLGITGINIPFIASNLAKDQVTAAINSNRVLNTSIANPGVFLKSLWTAIGHGAEYENWIRNAGGGTSFDISRSAPNVSISQLRAGRNIASNIAYTVTHPGQLLRTVENIVNRGEETTRLQQFIGMRDALLKEGRTLQDANLLAAKASRENTVNFARSGDWGKALNSVFLYLNAGIQGSRTLMRNLTTRPLQTAAKIGLTVFTPLATITAWNLSDPQRKAAYDDIRDFEKDNNLIIIPPNPTKDPTTGKWNVIKIPFSQEIANLTVPIRKGIEALQGEDGPGFKDFAASILGTGTSLNLQSPNALLGQFIPQAVKPELETALNKNLFTESDIVPQFINGQKSVDLPPEMQVRDNTSGTARIVGKVLNTSPLKVEQFVKSAAGGVGSQALNASDQALAATGIILKEQIGGQSITEGLTQRFAQASGGQQLTNLINQSKNEQPITKNPNITTTQAQPSNQSVKLNIVENNGKFYVSLGKNNVKAFDTQREAEIAFAKSQFEKSNQNFSDLGDVVLRKDSKGKVTEMPKDEFNYKLNDAQMTEAKKNNNFQTWLQLADQQMKLLQNRLNDPSVDQLDKITINNQIKSLISEYQKYKSYGGFLKAKAPKKFKMNVGKIKPIKIKAITLKSIKFPKIKNPKTPVLKSPTVAKARTLKLKV